MAQQKLPDDLLIEILSCLPTKYLIRFRCVSKFWNSLIVYVSSQRKILLPVSGLFIRSGLYASISPDPQNYGVEFKRRLRNLPFYSTCHVIHSCNGLFLFTLIAEYTTLTSYYVWNPATIEAVALPEVLTRPHSGKVCFLAYDPRQSPHYKVVRFTSHLTDTNIIIEVFSSITGMWVMYNVPSEYPVNLVGWSKMSVFYRGALYLLSVHDSGNLIRFDVEMSGFQLIDLPDKQPEPECYERINVDCIGESRGNLHYMVKPFTQDELNIYVLKELDTNKWVLTHKINTNEIFSGDFLPIAFHPESEIIYLSTRMKIISYHPCSGLLEEFLVGNCNCIVNWKTVFLVNPCMESIDPPGEKLIKLFALENTTFSECHVSEIESMSQGPQPDADDKFS